MKVLMICTEKLPVPEVKGGAIQTYISGITPFLKDQFNITILGINDPTLPDNEVKNGIHYVRIPGKVFNLYQDGVINFLIENQFDIIHIFNRPRLVLPVREVAPNAKIILSMHNDMFAPEKIPSSEAERVIDEVSAIVTVSNYIGNTINNFYPKAGQKIRTVYSGVDIQKFLPGNHPNMSGIRNQIRKQHGLEDKMVILFVGRLSANKGVDRLIRAIPEIAKSHKNIALVIMGSKWFSQDGVSDFVAYARSLARKLPIPVVSTGFVSPAEIQNWFSASDIFVCTSIWQEPLARVHYEAMASGLPIITTNRGGNPEVIIEGQNGFVVENPENPANFAEKILMLLNDKDLMKRMGENGRNLAINQYQFDRVANEVREVWNQVL